MLTAGMRKMGLVCLFMSLETETVLFFIQTQAHFVVFIIYGNKWLNSLQVYTVIWIKTSYCGHTKKTKQCQGHDIANLNKIYHMKTPIPSLNKTWYFFWHWLKTLDRVTSIYKFQTKQCVLQCKALLFTNITNGNYVLLIQKVSLGALNIVTH